jgi:transposase-like protein
MNIIQRARSFVNGLRQTAERSAWDWRRCPHCGSTVTKKNGAYWVRPYTLEGRVKVRVQRHRCEACGKSYSEAMAWRVRRSWYAREVHRMGVDCWQHGGMSLRRTAELVRSVVGKQERWLVWRLILGVAEDREVCYLSHSQLAGVPSSGQVATDGLWARLLGRQKRVVLALVDAVTGVMHPPVVVRGEESGRDWGRVFARAQLSGLDLDEVRGVTSDGAGALTGYLSRKLSWVNHQRCHFHLWRNLKGELAAAVQGATKELGRDVGSAVRVELTALARAMMDAGSFAEAEVALAKLAAHRFGGGLKDLMREHLDAATVYLSEYNRGLVRVSPEWYWRDFRLRLSRGRNHRSARRLERAALVWAIYRNFEPAQRRSERRRTYRHPGMSPLAAAGAPPGEISYLDALGV